MKTNNYIFVLGLSLVANITFGQIIYLDNSFKTADRNSYFIKIENSIDSAGLKIYSGTTSKDQKVKFITQDIKSRSGNIYIFYEKNILDQKGPILKGKKTGDWIFYYKNGQPSLKVEYVKDNPTKKILFDTLGNKCCQDRNGIDDYPKFQYGDLMSFKNYVIQNIKLEAIGTTGLVFIQFAVNEVGQIVDVSIVKGYNEKVDKQIIDFMESCPDWTPAYQFNRPVKVQMTLPIEIK